ncbi:hypothetical protein F4805DRAFT_428169 [Annulohypoxylon moriforme]|nr:hypothetical protein F4805DRAFT_428169 [Annulohypoxylon moriforme]
MSSPCCSFLLPLKSDPSLHNCSIATCNGLCRSFCIMADALSVTGAAVGIVSLGIQVCQGLISYYRSIEGRKQELTDGLREVQNLLVVFSSLNGILPQVNQRRPCDFNIIRECLEDSEKTLQELQLRLDNLKSSSTSSKIKNRMKETGRTALYHFVRDKLVSLRQTLHQLLHNLNLALTITSMKSTIEQETNVDTIKTVVENLRDASHTQDDEIQDVYSQIRVNTDQLQSLQSTATDILNKIESRLNRTEWSIKDLDEKVNMKLTMMQSNITLNQSVTADVLREMMEKFEAYSSDMARMNVHLSRIENQGSDERRDSPMGLKSSTNPAPSVPHPTANQGMMTKGTTLNTSRRYRRDPLLSCSCTSSSRSVAYSYVFCGMKFQFQQRLPRQHRQDCKFYGIDRKPDSTYEVQFPLKMGWFSMNMMRASIVLTTGNNSPGISVCLKNIVRWMDSPFCQEVEQFRIWLNNSIRIRPKELIGRLDALERKILGMYRDRKSSPVDRDENGKSHAMIFLQTVEDHIQYILANEAVATRFLQLLYVLMEPIQANNDKIEISMMMQNFELRSRQDNLALKQKFISSIIEFFNIDQLTITNCVNTRCNLAETFEHFPDLINEWRMELPPIVFAILSRSLPDLENCILQDPKAPMQIICDVTTLHMCASWPQGLRLLLTTEAKYLINSRGTRRGTPPIVTAVGFDCAESVDLLMKAGSQFDMPGLFRPELYSWYSDEVVDTVASNLAERRRALLSLAENELGISARLSPNCVPDRIAAILCGKLDNAGIYIPPILRVSPSYTTIYHCPEVPIQKFSIFFDNGFRDYAFYDGMGLTPVMITHSPVTTQSRLTRMFPSWLSKQGIFDQKPKDPWKIGLNLHATGWHYMASMTSDIHGSPYSSPNGFKYPWKLVNDISRAAGIRDNCVCWCSLKGCSPLTSLWKAYATSSRWGVSLRRNTRPGFTRHYFFHDSSMFGMDTDEVSASALQLEFLRFLTFETLGMEHTCCALSEVSVLDGKCVEIKYEMVPTWGMNRVVLVNRNPEMVRKVRADDSERRLLESLMDEFTQELEKMGLSPKVLERFLWGYWRRRMSELYAVDPKILDEMGQFVDNVQTHVLPPGALNFLGLDFNLLRLSTTRKAPTDMDCDENDDDDDSVEDINVSLPCEYCDIPEDCWLQIEKRKFQWEF